MDKNISQSEFQRSGVSGREGEKNPDRGERKALGKNKGRPSEKAQDSGHRLWGQKEPIQEGMLSSPCEGRARLKGPREAAERRHNHPLRGRTEVDLVRQCDHRQVTISLLLLHHLRYGSDQDLPPGLTVRPGSFPAYTAYYICLLCDAQHVI